MNQQLVEMQRQTIEQMKTAQDQIVEMNERVAESMMGMVPEMPAPFAEYMPQPTEMVSNYFDFMGELRTANRAFVESMMAAWAPAAAPATDKK